MQAVARGHKQRKSIAAQVMDRVVDTVEDAVNKVVDVVEDAVEKVVDVVEDAVEKVVDTVEDATYNMVEKLHDGARPSGTRTPHERIDAESAAHAAPGPACVGAVAEDVELDDAAKRIQTMWRGHSARRINLGTLQRFVLEGHQGGAARGGGGAPPAPPDFDDDEVNIGGLLVGLLPLSLALG